MKKIYYSIVVLALAFSSCDELNPLEDIYAELDATEEGVTDVRADEITLTEDDYSDLNLETSYFTDEDQAKTLLAEYLSSVYNSEDYPFLSSGSIVMVNYNLSNDEEVESVDMEVENYVSPLIYTLDTSDYPGAIDNASGFYETETPSDYMTDILTANYSTVEEGDVVLVKYNQYIGETEVGISEFYTKDFKTEQTLLDFEVIDLSGDQTWEASQYGVRMSGYDGGANENEDWLVSQEIDLTDNDNALFQVNQVLNYGSYDEVTVLISTNYSGDVTTATWDEIELTNVPEGNSWTEFLSDEYSLSAYNGEVIRIAFKYNSTTSSAPNWQIAQVYLKSVGVTGETAFNEIYYTYDGQDWEVDESVYYLTSNDYDEMGEEFGQPGRFNNFSSSVLPEDYLPVLLSNMFPYAQEEDSLILSYKYYDGDDTDVLADIYTYVEGSWSAIDVGESYETQLQFGYDGSNWVPDNTINYTFTEADYDTIANSEELAADSTYEAALSNLDYYGNFNRTGGSTTWSDEMLIKAIGIALNSIDPNAEDGQKYVVTVSIYDGSSGTEIFSMIKESGEWILNE